MKFPPIGTLIPHQGPAVVLAEVLRVEDSSCACRTVLLRESSLVRGGVVPAVMGLEILAQVAAVHLALSRKGEIERPPVGYLVSARTVELRACLLPPDEALAASIRRLGQVGLGATFSGFVEDAQGTLLLTASFTTRLRSVPRPNSASVEPEEEEPQAP